MPGGWSAATVIASAMLGLAGGYAAMADSPAAPRSTAQSLTMAWEAEPRTFDPRYAVDANSQYLENLLHCALIDFDQDGHIGSDLPHQLAQSWTWTTPTTLTIALKSTAHFADGTPVTAADVAATYAFFKLDKAVAPSPRKGAFRNVVSVIAKDPGTVVFTLQTPDASFLANLVVGILPARLASGPVLSDQDQVPGCGPFVLQKVHSTTLDLAANPHYSLGPAPKLNLLHIKIVKDENTRFAKLAAGELDLVQNLLSRDKVALIARDYPQLKVLRRPGLNTTYLGFNVRDPLLAHEAVRQAIAMAIDKDKIIKYVLNGMASPADTLLPASDPYHAPKLQVLPYDPARAKALLDAAGFKPGSDGKRLTISYKTTTDQTRVAVAKAVAAELRKIGVSVIVETLEWGRFKADVEHGHVQMWSLGWVGFKDPDIYRYAFATSSFPPDGGNRGWFSNHELDALLAQGLTETDPTQRRLAYAHAEQLIAAAMPYVFLWHEDVFAVLSTGVEGFAVYADGRLSALSATTKN